jgi:sugar-specific transcriptional regulator TrmB
MAKIHELLNQLGLAKHESEVYLALLETGPETVAGIAHKAHIDRPLVYRVLPALLSKGLIAKAPKGKRTHYRAQPPRALKQLHDEAGHALDTSLPILEQKFIRTGKRPHVTYLEGREGIISVYEDILQTLPKGGVFYRYSSSGSDRKKIYVPKDYGKRRDAAQIERYVITNKISAERKKGKFDLSAKAVPHGSDLFAYNITQLIYGDKIAFVDYNTETAVIIENPVIAQFQTRLFKMFYQKL